MNARKKAVKDYAALLNRDTPVKYVIESTDDEEFSEAIGLMSASYSKFTLNNLSDVSLGNRPPRLFAYSEADNGTPFFEEIFPFTQDDLDNSKCFILLCYPAQQTLFVWFGRSASDSVKRYTLYGAQAINNFLDSNPRETGYKNEHSFVIMAGQEPLEFTCNFRAWVRNQSITRRRSTITSNHKKLSSEPDLIPLEHALKKYNTRTYSYSQLLTDPLPTEVDPSRLESYLTDSEFATIFEMSKSEFYKLPNILQIRLKKRFYL
jgi:hypothetical protein